VYFNIFNSTDNFLENIRHVRPTPNEGHGSRYYLCKHWFGEQNEQRYTSIECHGFVCKKYRRTFNLFNYYISRINYVVFNMQVTRKYLC